MKRITVTLTVLALLGLAAVAHAGDEHPTCRATTTAAQASHLSGMGQCCVEAAAAGNGCCGKDAGTLQAKYTEYRAHERALSGMHACCAVAVDADKGCCGKDAAALQANYDVEVATARAELAALAGMHPCCATAVEEGSGCCGQDAAALQAKYEQAVTDVETGQKSAADAG